MTASIVAVMARAVQQPLLSCLLLALISSSGLKQADAFMSPTLGPLRLRVNAEHARATNPLSLRTPVSTARSLRVQRNQPTMVAARSSTTITKLEMPATATNDWEVHKFGGASLATPELYRTVGDLLIEESKGKGDGSVPTMAIVSAMGGMTDLLIGVVDNALQDMDAAEEALEKAIERQLTTLKELAPPEITDPIEANIRRDGQDILNVVRSLRLIRTVPSVNMELVTGFGEIWSAQTLNAYLQTKDVPCTWMDAREVLIVESSLEGLGEKGSAATGGVTPLWEETSDRVKGWWSKTGKEKGFLDLDYGKQTPIVVVTGFVAITNTGVPTTLKRSGSDYSATIFAKLMSASRVTMWKNTDGVYTADPRRVPEAFPIESLKYDEAMELAYFGAQVLHPSAMVPCIDDNIPVYVRNIFNPSFKGTVIQGRSPTLADRDKADETLAPVEPSSGKAVPIKGITSIDKVAVVNLEGASIIGVPGVARRFMQAMSARSINVLMITQASSEHSICVAVPDSQGPAAIQALEEVFELELARSTVNSVSLLRDMSVVAIIGEGMAFTPGVSSTFMRALATAGVNVRAIAQGSSERQVAVVVNSEDTTKALRSVHQAFTLSGTVVSVGMIGVTSNVAAELLGMLERQEKYLKDNLSFQVQMVAACTRDKWVKDEKWLGMPIGSVAERIGEEGEEMADLDAFSGHMEADIHPHRVVIDCSQSSRVADYYDRWLENGIHVIGMNKLVGSGPLERFEKVKSAAGSKASQWLNECTVGAALPVLYTIKDLLQTGDQINLVQGTLSGSLSYILKNAEKEPMSKALEKAINLGFTESDPRIDLKGLDVARKVTTLAREVGLSLELEDVEVESLIPEKIAAEVDAIEGTREEVRAKVVELMKSVDDVWAARVEAAANDGHVLRHVGVVDFTTGKAKVEVRAVDSKNPLYRLKAQENLCEFHTARYEPDPLIMKGPGAAPDITASGIFADLIRLGRTLINTY